MPTQDRIQHKLIERISDWPTQPGIYIMRDAANRILYVGKAKNLRNRIRSYFQKPETLTPKTRILVKKITELEFQVVDTELEALLLECNLIKKHKPRYNIRLKDDKNYPYIVLDFTHPFPQFRITRRVILNPQLRYFGPYSGGIRDIGRFLLKTFQIRDCSDSKFKNRTRPCLNYEIGICTAPCVDLVTQEDYSKQLQEAILFLKGKRRELISSLRKEMLEASENMEYERARALRDKIAAIERLSEKQNTVLTEKMADIDVIGCYHYENDIQWMVLFVRSGILTGRRGVRISSPVEAKDELTRNFLEQFYFSSYIPDEVWLVNDFEEREELAVLLSQRAGRKIQIRVKRNEKATRLLGMAYENAKLTFHDDKSKTKVSASKELQNVLTLAEPPHSIEGIDVSNFQGKQPAVALVHFADEVPLKSRYRLYYPKTIEGQDDFGMIYETVLRRFRNNENPPPDLLLIDGGKGQLQSALKAIEELGIEIPVCSLAKARTESGFTLKKIEKSEERIFVPNRKNPIILKEGHPALRLLQQVRDEAHRFSVKSHRRRRKKHTLDSSVLTDIPGIGETLRKRLLQSFGGIDGIANATISELTKAGVKKSVAERILSALQSLVPQLEE